MTVAPATVPAKKTTISIRRRRHDLSLRQLRRIGEVSERSSGGAALDVSGPYGHGEAKVSTTAGSTRHSDGAPLRLD